MTSDIERLRTWVDEQVVLQDDGGSPYCDQCGFDEPQHEDDCGVPRVRAAIAALERAERAG